MSVRVVARVRPLLKSEREIDVILRTSSNQTTSKSGASLPATSKKDGKNAQDKAASKDRDTVVRIPNPKNENEEYAFQFNAVYDADASQQELFDAEVTPTVKHLFNGFDITLFAYGVTGTGKTHTMRGGKSLADRGVIPRLLSGIYRRSRKIEKDSEGKTKVDVSLSYYEIYNDKVYDLFEPPEKRTLAGLPLRDNGGKTVVVGLTERPCTSLKEFESLYDQANANRSTSATKLNAHSSRSHAILCVKLAVTSGDKTRVSTASAIDLAGSEDNRRTDNGKERMVESASINKSLFVLAQCVEAMSRKQQRIPYRESKMTRILSLGQNNGLTVMILNLAPVRSFHLDTLSSLNFANRTKKIEVRDIENEPMFKGPPKPALRPSVASSGPRQPLRPLTTSITANMAAPAKREPAKPGEGKPVKAFSVYSDKPQPTRIGKPEGPKRSSVGSVTAPNRALKTPKQKRPSQSQKPGADVPASKIEEMVEKKVEELLAARALNDQSRHVRDNNDLNEQVQRRLELLEQRIEGTEDARSEGLSYLQMAKQHQARGENSSALKMFQLALPFFPNNEKLTAKISALMDRGANGKPSPSTSPSTSTQDVTNDPEQHNPPPKTDKRTPRTKRPAEDSDADYEPPEEDDDDSSPSDDDEQPPSHSHTHPANRKKRPRTKPQCPPVDSCACNAINDDDDPVEPEPAIPASPRSSQLLSIINSRDVSRIRLLRGVGSKKAEALVERLCEMDHQGQGQSGSGSDSGSGYGRFRVSSIAELSKLKGVGVKTVENMVNGVVV